MTSTKSEPWFIRVRRSFAMWLLALLFRWAAPSARSQRGGS